MKISHQGPIVKIKARGKTYNLGPGVARSLAAFIFGKLRNGETRIVIPMPWVTVRMHRAAATSCCKSLEKQAAAAEVVRGLAGKDSFEDRFDDMMGSFANLVRKDGSRKP